MQMICDSFGDTIMSQNPAVYIHVVKPNTKTFLGMRIRQRSRKTLFKIERN